MMLCDIAAIYTHILPCGLTVRTMSLQNCNIRVIGTFSRSSDADNIRITEGEIYFHTTITLAMLALHALTTACVFAATHTGVGAFPSMTSSAVKVKQAVPVKGIIQNHP